MKRASVVAFSLAGMVGWLGLSGCVSRAEFDKLHSSYTACESDREVLGKQLAAANAGLEALEREKAFWVADKDSRITGLMAQIKKADGEMTKLGDENRELRDKLTKLSSERAPVINISEGVKLTGPLHEKLKDFADKHPNFMEYDQQKGLIRFSSDVLFDLGSYQLKPAMAKQLGDFAELINIPEALKYDVLVVGHTDTVPVVKPSTKAKTPTNWHLSVYRAVSVLQVLKAAKVDPKRLGAMGFGAERPRVPNNPRGGTKQNRRVEIYLVPKGAIATTG